MAYIGIYLLFHLVLTEGRFAFSVSSILSFVYDAVQCILQLIYYWHHRYLGCSYLMENRIFCSRYNCTILTRIDQYIYNWRTDNFEEFIVMCVAFTEI